MKRAIIFGITGQDGSHLADLLLEKGYYVLGVSRRTSTDNTQRIKHILDNVAFELLEGDITDVFSVCGIFNSINGIDEVYNLAAQSHVATSFKQPALTWDITGKGCLNILQGLIDTGNTDVRFYQASSSEMFGANYDLKTKMKNSNTYVAGDISHLHEAEFVVKYQNEETKFLPQSPYAIAKCAAHYMTRLCREGYGLHASSGILFNHEGPRRGENFVTRKITRWIGDFHKWCITTGVHPSDNILLRDCNISDTIYRENGSSRSEFPKLRLGNLESYRDWGYAGDYCEAMWLMLQQDQPDDYVICTGETHKISDFLRLAFAEIGVEDWRRFITIDPEFYRPAEVDFLRGDCSKARTKLGWKPKHSFQDLVKIMVQHDIEQ